MTLQARCLSVKAAVELSESLLNVVAKPNHFPFQAVLQIDNELFQVLHGSFNVSYAGGFGRVVASSKPNA